MKGKIMKPFLLFAVLSLACAGNAFADSSYRGCAASNSSVCATLDFSSPIDTKDEGVFVVTVEAPDTVQALNVSLWMNMGTMSHKGAPVEISALDNNRFQVDNAWFVMKGTWTVLVDFTSDNTPYHLEIPVDVTQ